MSLGACCVVVCAVGVWLDGKLEAVRVRCGVFLSLGGECVVNVEI